MTSDSELDSPLDLRVIDSASGTEGSDGEKLVIETTRKRKAKIVISESDKKLLADFEESLETALEEKAAKVNLKNNHVKHILKQVITNEDVIAYVKHATMGSPNTEPPVKYEPKLTRSKAKELQVATVPWKPVINPTPFRTQALIHAELPEEESSGDEYVPIDEPDEESEDEKESSVASDCGNASLDLIEPPATPPTPQSADCGTQTNWSEDGIFKIPAVSDAQAKEDATIALRTRSKLCMNDTDLDELVQQFVPPDDLPTEMCDMDCDDEDWQNFLAEFTRPLEEVAKPQEDEDHDPEYNVLADEDLDNDVDHREELRMDKGVKITRKELNELIAELVDYADNYNNYFAQPETSSVEQPDKTINRNEPVATNEVTDFVISVYREPQILENQVQLVEQQIRQHVQLLAQTFLLSYAHPDLQKTPETCKELLHELKKEMGSVSFYRNCLVENALELVSQWIEMLDSDTPIVRDYKLYWTKLIYETKQAKSAGISYVPRFHKLLLETISNSSVFLYPALLPRIPVTLTTGKLIGFSDAENELIALGLEQFIPYLKTDKRCLKSNGELKMKDVAYYIKVYMMPPRNCDNLYKHISKMRTTASANPIKHYFENGTAPVTIHYVIPLHGYQEIPPCKRNPNELPLQWCEYIHPDPNAQQTASTSYSGITKVNKPPVYNKKFVRRQNSKSVRSPPRTPLLVHDELFTSTPKCKKSLFKLAPPGVKKGTTSNKLLKGQFELSISQNMAAEGSENMPMLYITESEVQLTTGPDDPIEVLPSMHHDSEVVEGAVEGFEETGDNDAKDNLDDINALVLASSTIKTAAGSNKRRPSGNEKKRAKMKREFSENLRLLSEEDSDVLLEKRNRLVGAFYDKVQETLELEDFHKFMTALNDFDEMNSSPQKLYSQVESILDGKHPDILREFLLFFDSIQAKAIGKLVPYLMVSNMSLFLRKLEIFFQDQPSQVRKIYRTLNELVSKGDATMAQVKSTVLPLLKGNSLLTDWFLQIFPMEKPPSRLVNNGAWENICLNKEKDLFETIVLPEVEDPYGGPNCICSCHNVDEPAFKARSRHCTPCGTKFMQGRVYVNTGKCLRPAKITFNDTSIDHRVRLSGGTKQKRSETCPMKQISPGKDSQDETRQSSDDDVDKKQRKQLSSLQRRKQISPQKRKGALMLVECKKEPEDDEDGALMSPPKIAGLFSDASMSHAPGPSAEGRLSPEHCPSAESESEFCEDLETSQDNNSDSDVSIGESQSMLSEWTREEDKIILETFQREEVMDIAFTRILEYLKGRSLEQVKGRFDVLINFLKKMSQNRDK